MIFETEKRKRQLQHWSRFAIQLNGAVDAGAHDHLTTAVIRREVQDGSVFDLLTRELPPSVWAISKLTDTDRHELLQHWKQMTLAYDPEQFHVSRNGLALLVAYILHLLDIFHATPPA
jgi:hypothetical protein